ncbi:Hpt domain-containing protein [Pseudohoeflea suaedae]|uniref:Hpt domain-containing protein n=1 Tax=Pseudohoeflea suaedae TaxID=877384 RepID=A0A4R5PMB1_9HYPH|nr:Hpt domain-containing protein [Pseudohoeflea suaedae]TDH38122.1 Hpt domain-containing protein [Pseudohoeflea suaedae]
MDLDVFAQRFRARCATDLAVLKEIRDQPGDLAASPRRPELTERTHKIVGSGALFGYPEASEKARLLEDLLVDQTQPSHAQLAAALDELVKTLESIVR